MLNQESVIKSATALKNKGNSFFSQNNYKEALNYYNQAIHLYSDFKEAWLNKAFCHQQLNAIQDAFDALTKAIEIEPTYTKAVYKKAELLMSLELFELALEIIDRYIANEGNDEQVISLRRRCAENYAKQLLGEKIVIDISQFLKMGEHFQSQSQFSEAKKYFTAVMALEPMHPDAMRKLMDITAALYDGTPNTMAPAALVSRLMQGMSPQAEQQLIRSRLSTVPAVKLQQTQKKKAPTTSSASNLSRQLLEAIKSDDVNLLQVAINAGADINALLITGQYPLYIPHKNYESANPFSIESIARFRKAQPEFGEYPLYLAASLGKLSIIDCLLRHGANVNQTDNYGLTALMIAIHNGHFDGALRLLAELHIKVNHAIQDGSTALIFACEKGIKIVVEKLIEKRADVNQADEEGETPLIIALKHVALVPVLLQAGANPNQCTLTGVSPLFFAAQSNQLEGLKQLIFFGAELELTRKSDAVTALMIASHQGHPQIVFYLLACGANYKAKCKNQLSAIDYAKNNGHHALHTQLLDYQKKHAEYVAHYEKARGLISKKDYANALIIFDAISQKFVVLYQKQVSLDLAKCYESMALCYKNLGKIAEVNNYTKQANEIYQLLFGKNDRHVKKPNMDGNQPVSKLSEQDFFNHVYKMNCVLEPKNAQHISIDLHGCSVVETKKIIAETLSKVNANNITEFYIITGWGKHTNSQGNRGVLKKILPELLTPYALSIANIQEEKGAYKIVLKRAQALLNQQNNLYQLFFNETNLESLIQNYKQESRQGNTLAMILLADLYLYQDIPGKNNTQAALDLLYQAKAKGSFHACVRLGEIYREGKKVKPNLKKAFSLFQEAADRDCPLGQYWVGKCYLTGECVKRDDRQGFFWMKKAADAGFAYAQHSLAESYFKGDFTPLDQQQAFKYYKKAADLGLTQAQVEVARHYACGYGTEPSYLKAFHYYWLAAHQDDIFAICQVASYLNSDRIGELDVDNSFRWFLKGAELGDVDCQAMTAIFYYYGRGVEQDITKAVEWVTKAKLSNQKEALLLLSHMHFSGIGANQDTAQGIVYLTQAADAGSENAQQELIMRYMTGRGVPANPEKAHQLREEYARKAKEIILPSHPKQNNPPANASAPHARLFKPAQNAPEVGKNTQKAEEITDNEKQKKSSPTFSSSSS